MLFVLLIVGAVVLARAPMSEEELGADEPLVWADVERQFERVDRQGPGPVEPEAPGVRPTTDPRPAGAPTGRSDRDGAEPTTGPARR